MQEQTFQNPQEFSNAIQLREKFLTSEILITDIREISEEVFEAFSLYRNEFYEVNIVNQQTGFEFVIDGKKYIPKGEPYINLVAPNQLQSYKVLQDDESIGYLIYFSKNVFHQLKKQQVPLSHFKIQNESYYQISQEEFEMLQFWCDKMKVEQNKTSAYQTQILVNLLAVLIFKYANIISETKSAISSRPQEVIDYFLDLISESKKYKNVSQYAQEMALTSKQLNDLSKKVLGKNALKVIQTNTAEKAKSLLLQSNLSVKEIAYRLGFFVLSNFSRLFKNVVGISPQKFRESSLK